MPAHNARVESANNELTRGQKIWQRLLPLRPEGRLGWSRFKLYSEEFMKEDGLPWEIVRAKSFANVMHNIPIYVEDDQLLVGDWGTAPMCIEVFPEIHVSWIKDYIISKGSDFDNAYQKGFDPIKDEAERDELLKICDYWMKYCVRERHVQYVGDEYMHFFSDRNEEGAWCFASYLEATTPKGWVTVDFASLLEKGVVGFKEDLKAAREAAGAHCNNIQELHRKYFWQGCEIVLDAMVDYAHRYAALCDELAAKCPDAKRKAELEKMAAVCRRVPEFPARDFHEAVQSLYFGILATFYDTNAKSLGYGRVDQYLYPSYKASLAEGADEKDILDILECFRCKIIQRRNNRAPLNVNINSPENQFHNCTLGGVDAEGNDAVNELSFLWLKAAFNVRTPHPTLSVRWHSAINQDFMMEACKLVKTGLGFPAFFGDTSNIDYLLQHGVALETARDYSMGGCVLAGLPGMADTWPAILNMPQHAVLALYNGLEPITGKEFGVKTGNLEDMKSWEEFYDAVKKQIRQSLELSLPNINEVRGTRAEYYFETAMSIFDGCIPEGVPLDQGGAKYKFGTSYIMPVGLVDTANTITAVKKLVFEQGVDPIRLKEALLANFEGYEDILALCKAVPTYGNDNDEADQMVVDLYNWMCDEATEGIPAMYGEKWQIAPHSTGLHANAGKKVMALPFGRPKGVSIADGGASPSQGTDLNGPIATIKSAGKINHSKIFGTLMNMRFTPTALKTDDDLRKLNALIATYLGDYEGKHIQFNVVDTETLIDARENPQNYSDMIVRVAGYSALWTDLNRNIWTDIIRRTEQCW